MEKDIRLPSVKLTAAAERELRALVKLEMAGACHLCGSCTTACPEHIAVTDMIRYHAYVHQYNDKALARELYAKAGYDPSRLCNHCGVCADVCPSDVRISEILAELPLAVRA
jgi:predicted aldo/keto reductase-like oxidoreductase